MLQENIIEVGKLWPSAMPPYDGSVALIKNRSFDAACFLSNPTKEEIDAFREAPLKVHVFVFKNVPFVIFSYEGTDFNWEVSLCFVNATKEQIDAFLQPGNLIALFMVDRKSSLVRAMRVIAINEELENSIKDAVKRQFDEKLSREEFNRRIDEAYYRYTTEDFIKFGLCMEFSKSS